MSRLALFLAKYSEREKWLMSATVWALAVFVGAFALLKPSVQKYKKASFEKQKLEQNLKELSAVISELEQLQKEKKAMEQELHQINSEKKAAETVAERLKSVSMIDFMKSWTSVAQGNSVKLDYVKPLTDSQQNKETLSAEISVKGKFVHLLSFFTALDSRQKVPMVKALTLTPSESGYPYLKAVLQLELRLKP